MQTNGHIHNMRPRPRARRPCILSGSPAYALAPTRRLPAVRTTRDSVTVGTKTWRDERSRSMDDKARCSHRHVPPGAHVQRPIAHAPHFSLGGQVVEATWQLSAVGCFAGRKAKSFRQLRARRVVLGGQVVAPENRSCAASAAAAAAAELTPLDDMPPACART